MESVIIFVAMPCGYGRVRTLADASVRNCKGDIRSFRPSIMVGVPTVLESQIFAMSFPFLVRQHLQIVTFEYLIKIPLSMYSSALIGSS